MKTTILFLALASAFVTYSQDDSTINIVSDPAYLINNNPELKKLSFEEKERLQNEMHRSTSFGYVTDNKNLIDEFGANYFLMNRSSRIELVANHLAKKFAPMDVRFDKWKERLDTLQNVLFEQRLNNRTISPMDYAFDGLIYFDNLAVLQGRLMYSDSLRYSELLWNYTEATDPLTGFKMVREIEEIHSAIDAHSNPEVRANAYILFLQNLYNDQNWNTLFYTGQKFIDDLINEFIEIDESTFRDPSITVNLDELAYYPIDYPNQTGSPIDMKMNKIKWIVTTLKMLITVPLDNFNARDHILHNFGKVDGMLKSEETFENQHQYIKLLELDYFRQMCFRNPFDMTYIQAYERMLLDVNQTDVFQKYDIKYFRIRYSEICSFFWRNHSRNGSDYDEFFKMVYVQYLYNSLKDFNEYPIVNREDYKWYLRCLSSLAAYFSLERKYAISNNILIQALEFIESEENRSFFVPENVDQFSHEIALNWHNLGDIEEANRWMKYSSLAEIDSLYIPLKGDVSNWEYKDVKNYANEMIRLYRNDTTGYNGSQAVDDPAFRYVLTKAEEEFESRGKYKKAYSISKIRSKFFQIPWSGLSNLKDIREWNVIQVLDKKEKQQKIFQKDYIARNQQLIEDIIDKSKRLHFLEEELLLKEKKLKMLHDSVADEQALLILVKDSVRTYREKNTKLSLNNISLDSLNKIIIDEKLNAEIARDSTYQANAELNGIVKKLNETDLRRNILLTILSVLLLALLILAIRLRQESKKAISQKNLTETLFMGFSQMGHFGKDLIEAFSKRFHGPKDDDEEEPVPECEEAIVLDRIGTFLSDFSVLNMDGVSTQSIDMEINTAKEIVSLLYTEQYSQEKFDKLYTIKKDLRKKEVPIYTVANLIVNTFKHSILTTPIQFQINELQENESFSRIEVRDFAQKKEPLGSDSSGNGTDFIKQMFELHNKKIPTDFTLQEWSDGNNSGVVAQFNLKKIA